MPGIIESIFSSGPIFLIWLNWSLRSSKVNLFSLNLFCNLTASFVFTASWAFSTRLTISPIPRILDAILSGWNGSRASIFSLAPINLTGFPVTAIIERAAPPLASPSILVRIMPSILSLLSNDFAIFTASCPVMASATSRISFGFASFFISSSSFINCSSM